MSCAAPIVVRNRANGLLVEVACGQCRSCRLKRARSWVGRLTLESRCHSISRFITLTYADDPGELDYRDFQLFMKKYREKKGDVRFFVVGEYGGRNGRGHYHAILFGHPPECYGHCLPLQEVWGHGYCDDKPLIKERIGYVARYCFKDNYSPGKMPFVRMSLKPGIGMESIAQLGKAASAHFREREIAAWPTNYYIDGKHYPLCTGGLIKFQTSFIENGGLPPTICNPIERDFAARNRHHPEYGRGSRVFEEQQVLQNLERRYADASALKKER